MTTETTPPNSSDAELDELRHFRTMATAELDALRPLALQSAIRSSGFEPTSSAGRVLAELAKTDPQLAASPEALKRKASQLGLSTNVAEQPPPSAPAATELTDPSRPATHSANTPGTAEHDKALARKTLRDPFREAAERMLSPESSYEDAPSPLREAAEMVADKWNPATPKPNPWRAKTVDVPPPTDAERVANKEAYLAQRKTADAVLRSITRETAAKMFSR